MPARNWSDEQLDAYLRDELPAAELSSLEHDLRTDSSLRERLEALSTLDESHSVGEIWRRHRLSCPSREELQRALEGRLSREQSLYIEFHLNSIGCEICEANYADLQAHSERQESVRQRRRTIFESSAGFLNVRHKK